MDAFSSTYRRISALLTLALVLSIGLPVLQHVCAMDGSSMMVTHMSAAHDMADDCHDDDGHDAEHTCDGEACHDIDRAISDRDCEVFAADLPLNEAFLADRTLSISNDLAPAATESNLLLGTGEERVDVPLRDFRTPSPPVSLHVLHETYLI